MEYCSSTEFFSKPNWIQHTKWKCNKKEKNHNTIDRTEMKRNRNETNSVSLINCNEIQYDAMRFHGGWWNGMNFHEPSTRLNKMYSLVMKYEATHKMHYRNVTTLTGHTMQYNWFSMLRCLRPLTDINCLSSSQEERVTSFEVQYIGLIYYQGLYDYYKTTGHLWWVFLPKRV
jgi:hypothetical protein